MEATQNIGPLLDPKLMGLLTTLASMVMLTLVVFWLGWTIGRVRWLYDRRKWLKKHREKISGTGLLVVIVLSIVALVRIGVSRRVEGVLLRSVQRQTKGMNTNLVKFDKRVSKIENDRGNLSATLEKANKQIAKVTAADEKKKADAAQKKADEAEKVRMRAVFAEEIAKIREIVEKETGLSWKQLLEQSTRKEK